MYSISDELMICFVYSPLYDTIHLLNCSFFPHFSHSCFLPSCHQALPGDSSWVSQWASLAANHTRTDPEGSGAETAAFLHKERGILSLDSKRMTRHELNVKPDFQTYFPLKACAVYIYKQYIYKQYI